MDSKLSAFKYIRNNKKTVGVLMTALTIAFVAIYLIYFLLITTTESMKPILLELPKKITYVDISPETFKMDLSKYSTDDEANDAYLELQDELCEKLKKYPDITDAYYVQIIYAQYKSVMGGWGYEMPLIKAEQIPEFLEHMDAKLIEGKLPENDGEVLIDSVVMKNNNYELGGWYMEKQMGKMFKISGVIESDCMACVGTPMGYWNSGYYLVILNDDADIREILKEEGIELSESDSIIDKIECEKDYNEDIKDVMESAISVIFIIVMVFIAISVLVAYVSFMRNRVNEYCLYTSIGFGRSSVYGMIIREMLMIFGGSMLFGFIVSISGAMLLKTYLLAPKGLVNYIFHADAFGKIAAMYVFIIGILQIPVIININGIKTIDAIED